jgi:5-methylcytosine-specific restriction endonuclease McrA
MKNLILVDNPHIQSRAAYLLLKKKIKLIEVDIWLEFRKQFLNNLPELTCSECGKTNLKITIENDRDKAQLRTLATIDHIKPLAKGGNRYDYDNLQLMCFKCNQRKKDYYEEETTK